MSKSLLEQLPQIVAAGKKQAEQILEGLEGKHRIGLQTREIVIPAKDSAHADWIRQGQWAQHVANSQQPTANSQQLDMLMLASSRHPKLFSTIA